MRNIRICSLTIVAMMLCSLPSQAQPDYSLYLSSGTIRTGIMRALPMAAAATDNKHFLVQFDGPLSDDQKSQLADDGIELLQYVPNYAYTVRATSGLSTEVMRRHGIRWVDFIQPDYKLSPVLRDPSDAPWAARAGDSIQLTVAFHRDEPLSAAVKLMEGSHQARVIGVEPTTHSIDVVVPIGQVAELPQLEQVFFVEPALPEPIEDNNSSRQNINADAVQAAPYNLDGSGVMLAQWDGGRADATHGDFGGRLIQTDASALSTHATHVAGTVMGSGAGSSGTYRGMAPGAQMLTKQWFGSGSEAFNDYQNAIAGYAARVSQNSWGYGPGDPASQSSCESVMGNYWAISGTIDNIVRGDAGAPIVAVWSAGNQRGNSSSYCGSLGWSYNTTDPLASAKNVITVGAVNSNNSSMTSFSSWGPTDDGRLKPDVVGPGCQSSSDFGVTSCKQVSGYTVMCGTSMSAPAVSGVIALVMQRHDQLFPNDTLLPSTVKALLINSATDLGNIGPDFQYGYGRVDALAAVTKVSAGEPSYVKGSMATGSATFYDLTVPSGATRIRVTLAWDDPGATSFSGVTLVNDLDLRLIDPNGVEWSPWVMSAAAPALPATRTADHLNNVETVELNSPTAGLWRAKVTGYNVPQGPQRFSLVFTPDGIHTPGQYHALAVTDLPDTTVMPGEIILVPFWVKNLGSPDSIRVRLTDSVGWMGIVADTVVLLSSNDSAMINAVVTVPSNSTYGQSEAITCRITSMTDSIFASSATSRVLTKRLYGLAVNSVDEDTVDSPSSLTIPVTIANLGNSTDNVIVNVASDSAWTISPVTYFMPLGPGLDSTFSVTISIPSEVPSGSTSRVEVKAHSTGGLEVGDTVNIYVANSSPTPTLLSPDTIVYAPSRIYSFEWQGIGDSFSVQIATDAAMTTLVRTYGGIQGTTFAMPLVDSLSDGVYYWAVRAYVGADSSALPRVIRKIGVDNIAPKGVTPDSPTGGYVTIKPFQMSLVSNGTTPKVAPEFVTVQLSPDSTFAGDPIVFDSIVPLQFGTPQILPDGRWYWQARRSDKAGNASAWSTRATFVLDTEVPATPVPLAPTNGTELGGAAIVLDWSAAVSSSIESAPEYYHVHVSKNSNFTDFTTFLQDVFTDSATLATTELASGRLYYWRVKASDSAGFESAYSPTQTFTWYNFTCGDLDGTHTVDIGDLTSMITFMFLGGTLTQPLLAGAIDCDHSVDISDLTWMISYLFLLGPDPCCQ